MAKPLNDVLAANNPPPINNPTYNNTLLRPPGAIDEKLFISKCDRSGQCALACPASCIVINLQILDATPHIIAKNSPCVICDDLSCMKACPSGALQVIDSTDIKMGVAAVHHISCLRTRGEDCQLCIEQCPVGDSALHINNHDRIEVLDACTGCGICEFACPTAPPAIEITPTTALNTPGS